MKRISILLASVAAALIGVVSSSCTRLEPSEVTSVPYPFTATAEITVSYSGTSVGSGRDVVLKISDNKAGVTYSVTRKTNAQGMVIEQIGCSEAGVSVTASCQAVLTNGTAKEYVYGSNSASLTTSNKFHSAITVTLSK